MADLLAERFHLRTHMERKEFSVYQLSVAKGGSKLRVSGAGPVKQEPGFPAVPAGRNYAVSAVPPRNLRYTFRGVTMQEFIGRVVSWPLVTFGPAGGATVGRVDDLPV